MRTTISVFSFVFFLTAQAQEINFEQNWIVSGDSIEQRRLDFEEFDLQGKDHVWSLEGMKADKKRFKSDYLERKDTLIGREQWGRMLYNQTKEGIKVVGMQDNLLRISYDMPEEWLRFPMKQGDSISGYFNGTGLYCDRLTMRRFGTFLTKADSVGKMILPDGETLYGVMRLHTERQVNAIYADKDSMMFKEDVYRWYATGYRYPILEAKVTTLQDKPIEQLLFYCLPEEQELLASNDVNKDIRDAVAKAGEVAQSENEAKTRGEDDFKYEIDQDDHSVTIHYQTDHHEKISALLANNQGYVYQRQKRNGQKESGTITISTNGLRRGQYVLYLNVDGKGYAEKINVK